MRVVLIVMMFLNGFRCSMILLLNVINKSLISVVLNLMKKVSCSFLFLSRKWVSIVVIIGIMDMIMLILDVYV